jgi:hypothetical protein
LKNHFRNKFHRNFRGKSLSAEKMYEKLALHRYPKRKKRLPGEFPSTDITNERFFSGVGADVRRQVVAAAERSHADATLERLLTCKACRTSG